MWQQTSLWSVYFKWFQSNARLISPMILFTLLLCIFSSWKMVPGDSDPEVLLKFFWSSVAPKQCNVLGGPKNAVDSGERVRLNELHLASSAEVHCVRTFEICFSNEFTKAHHESSGAIRREFVILLGDQGNEIRTFFREERDPNERLSSAY